MRQLVLSTEMAEARTFTGTNWLRPAEIFRLLARRPALLLAMLTTIGACADASPHQATEPAENDGIQTVGPTSDQDLPWQFEQLWHLSPANDNRLVFTDLARQHVAVDTAGHILVLDEAAHHVLLISAGGEVLSIFGRSGEGPGELKYPTALTATTAGISVYDLDKQSLVRWSASGELLPELRMPASFWGPLIRTMGTDTVLFTAIARADASTSEQSLVELSPSGQRQLAFMTRQRDQAADFPTCGLHDAPIAPLLAPELVWDASGSRVAVNTTPEYRLSVFENGEEVLSIHRDVPLRRVTRELAMAEVAEGMPIPVANCTVPAHEVVRGRGYADVLPSIRDVVLAPDGELWVLRGTFRGEPALIDVYSADAAYRGTLPPESPFPAAFLPSGDIVAVERDALGAATVVLYRVHRGGNVADAN